MIEIEEKLRLRRGKPNDSEALTWYQNQEVVYLVDGVRESYSLEKLQRMYAYLDQVGELYTIEVQEETDWKAIGDVTFSQNDLPIVIGDSAYRGQGLGKKIVQALVAEAKKRGYSALHVREIYKGNYASQKCFTACGFEIQRETEKGYSYRRDL
ncbi:GNAT family N-acetyltransferase [Streptococcus sp. zg-86]|uniref:GNAT family N-acetyltransferase n=1 Tax=Streptococcus zhangguiae TaxID=2664091 RepID=A0A6I4RTY8_9STRE|nr:MULTISPECIES: GNAT family N-acetyltransferase [unclassified Streptococcus]MTB64525.1 GNAT family N-acetyltransferase [Streptococcus sp. zg-86]MTB90785.1 GNAT family N-acetyltransferase [Streptococcus sp. zg-36]MWV56512.1 GNAT family N-acetyltransferase [Streptococcus sp. zg-70]QTH47282.1 GNAT family N-acetyltransferase [Streptococcus sp. zg-86]